MIKYDTSKIRTVFVDCFDTIILRSNTPNDVIESWLRIMADSTSIQYDIIKGVWEETKSVLTAQLNGREETTFREIVYEIYKRLHLVNLSIGDFDAYYEKSLNCMIQTECKVDYVNNEVITFLKLCKSQGIHIYCVSDFYLPQEAIKVIYSHLGILSLFDEIYVSSEVGKRKSSGNLYDFLLHLLRLEANEVLMIGDNKHSDYIIPKHKGLQTLQYKYDVKCSSKEVIYGQFRTLFDKNNKQGTPFANYSFSLYLFCVRLLNEIKRLNISHVYFFSREGESIKRFFDIYLSLIKEEKITTHYLYVSRKATYLPSFRDLYSENFERLKKQFYSLSIAQFLDNIGLLEIVIRDSRLVERYDLNKIHENFWTSEDFINFCEDKKFIRIYEESRTQKYNEALNYYKRAGLVDNLDNCCIVDIGWKGTIQDNLQKIIKHKVVGFYYGIRGIVDSYADNQKYGLLFTSFPCRNEKYDLFSINCRMLERVLYASHGSCLGYQDGQPLLEEMSLQETKLYNTVKETQIEIEHDIREIYNNISNNHAGVVLLDSLIERIHEEFLLYSSLEKQRQFQLMNKNQKMSPGDANNRISKFNMIKAMVKLIKHKKYLEFMNKLNSVMCSIKLHRFAVAFSRLSLRVLRLRTSYFAD